MSGSQESSSNPHRIDATVVFGHTPMRGVMIDALGKSASTPPRIRWQTDLRRVHRGVLTRSTADIAP